MRPCARRCSYLLSGEQKANNYKLFQRCSYRAGGMWSWSTLAKSRSGRSDTGAEILQPSVQRSSNNISQPFVFIRGRNAKELASVHKRSPFTKDAIHFIHQVLSSRHILVPKPKCP